MKNIRILALILLLTGAALAQGTGFNFQGRLNDGANPANGSYDLQFTLYSAITGGTQIGSPIPRPNTTLINGVFSVTLDFGPTAFNNNPNSIFLEIGVKPSGSPNAYTILGPRQQLTVVPFAVRAASADNANFASIAAFASNAQNAINAEVALDAGKLNGLTATDFIRNSTTAQTNSNFNISGSGVIGGNLIVQGNNTSGGNVAQNRDKGGLIKALIFVNFDGTVLRCYNGITGANTGNCGFGVTRNQTGFYGINFNFQVNDRFVSVSAQTASTVNIGATFAFVGTAGVNINTFLTDVDWSDSEADNPFMIIVY